MASGAQWDIFCKVIDNYGDVGVTWRLARQLVAEYGQRVRLWLDDLQPLQKLWPDANASVDEQTIAGVDVRRWRVAQPPAIDADIVIEAFACHLPETSLPALAEREPRSVWLNLEYLSAEDWVNDCHGLPSIHPQLPLTKYFFFPGFTDRSGGLLRERHLLDQRRAFQHEGGAREALLANLGVALPAGARLFSLFSYETAAIDSWLTALAESAQPTVCVVPEGRALAPVAAWCGVDKLEVGASVTRGALTVQVLPFLAQDSYDRLLWACDFNMVRGEDSFVRAQWAGRPFGWHIYPQADDAHRVKLAAFYELYGAQFEPMLAQAQLAFAQAWSAGENVAAAWQTLEPQWLQWQRGAVTWSDAQGARPDLASALIAFCEAHR